MLALLAAAAADVCPATVALQCSCLPVFFNMPPASRGPPGRVYQVPDCGGLPAPLQTTFSCAQGICLSCNAVSGESAVAASCLTLPLPSSLPPWRRPPTAPSWRWTRARWFSRARAAAPHRVASACCTRTLVPCRPTARAKTSSAATSRCAVPRPRGAPACGRWRRCWWCWRRWRSALKQWGFNRRIFSRRSLLVCVERGRVVMGSGYVMACPHRSPPSFHPLSTPPVPVALCRLRAPCRIAQPPSPCP